MNIKNSNLLISKSVDFPFLVTPIYLTLGSSYSLHDMTKPNLAKTPNAFYFTLAPQELCSHWIVNLKGTQLLIIARFWKKPESQSLSLQSCYHSRLISQWKIFPSLLPNLWWSKVHCSIQLNFDEIVNRSLYVRRQIFVWYSWLIFINCVYIVGLSEIVFCNEWFLKLSG